MTQRELVLGSATFLVVIVAGFFSAAWVTRHYAADVTQHAGNRLRGHGRFVEKLGLGERAGPFAEMRYPAGPAFRETFN